MSPEDQELLLSTIDEAFGFTKHDFEEVDGKKVPIYKEWGEGDKVINIEDLGDLTFKISKNLGDIYIEKIYTNGWVIVGEGTTLHCHDLTAGMGYVTDFGGYLL